MRIGVPKETHEGERRVATTPDVAEQWQKLGYSVAVEKDAGVAASYSNDAYVAAGCEVVDAADIWSGSDIILVENFPGHLSDATLVGQVTPLPANFIDASDRLLPPCAARTARTGSFVVQSHPTLAPPPDSPLSPSLVGGAGAAAADSERCTILEESS